MAMLGGGRCGGRPQHVVTVPLRVRVRWGVERCRAPRGGPSLVVAMIRTHFMLSSVLTPAIPW